MKIFFLSLIAFTLFAFSSKVNLNSSDISAEKMVKQTIQYKNGTTSIRLLSVADLQKLDFSKDASDVNNCTVQTPTGDCSRTASTCNAALAAFGDCLCSRGFTQWCSGKTVSDGPN